jgi:hypothetical protein
MNCLLFAGIRRTSEPFVRLREKSIFNLPRLSRNPRFTDILITQFSAGWAISRMQPSKNFMTQSGYFSPYWTKKYKLKGCKNMKKTLKNYTKATIDAAIKARQEVISANEDYDLTMSRLNADYSNGLIGKVGFDQEEKEAQDTRDTAIQAAIERVKAIGAEFSTDAAESGALNGFDVDTATINLLNSGISLTVKDMQILADRFADNPTMTRILSDRWTPIRDSIREKNSKLDGLTPPEESEVDFAANPAVNIEPFNRFVDHLSHSCVSDYFSTDFANRESYWNHCGRDVLTKMEYLDHDADQANFSADFPVEYATSPYRGKVW